MTIYHAKVIVSSNKSTQAITSRYTKVSIAGARTYKWGRGMYHVHTHGMTWQIKLQNWLAGYYAKSRLSMVHRSSNMYN